MRRFLIAVFLLALPMMYAAGTRASAQASAPVGDPAAGKVHYTFGNTSCSNCHGVDGEGRFGPPLAGRKIPYARFRAYIRNPLGRMFSYPESELTDQEIADMVAYLDTLTAGAKPPTAEWRTPLPKMAPRGAQLAGGIWGCTQCHGASFDTPRHGAAEVTGDFEWFKRMVYDHTKTQREQMAMLDPNLPRVTPGFGGPATRMPPRIRMGNYNRTRLPEASLKEIYDWMIDLGRLPVLNARVTAGASDASGATYTIAVANSAVKDKGVGVQGVQVALALPAGAKVVKTTGEGYQGVRHDDEAKADVAVWKIASMPAAAQQTLTVTLAAPAPQLRGRITWDTPAVKADPEVDFAYSATGGRGRGGA